MTFHSASAAASAPVSRRFPPGRFAWFLLLAALAWLPAAHAITNSCGIVVTPTSVAGDPGTSTTFSVSLNEAQPGDCGSGVTGTIAVNSTDTTGGTTFDTTFSATAASPATVNLTFGSSGGGTVDLLVSCGLRLCYNDTTSVVVSVFVNNVYSVAPTNGITNLLTNQITPVTLGVEVQENGAPYVGQSVDYYDATNTYITSATTDASGHAEYVASISGSGSYGVHAGIFCDGICPYQADFNITVESVTVTPSTPATGAVSATGSIDTVLEAHYGSASINAPLGTAVNWSVSSQPVGGDGSIVSTTTVDASGITTARFTATVPGVYSVLADSGCKVCDQPNYSFTVTVAPPPTLTVVSGDGQAGLAGTVADNPLVVQLLDGSGAPIVGATVDWTVPVGDALVTASSVTDASGNASATLTYGATPGGVRVQASALSGQLTAFFSATVQSPDSLMIVSGDGQSDNPSATLAQPLVVQVVPPVVILAAGRTSKPQSLSGIIVTWTVTAGGGSVSSGTSTTDANGQASIQYTLGASPGTNTIQASVPGVPAVSFTATALAPTLSVVSGNGQTRLVGTVADNPLVVKLLDGLGAPLSGQTVTWTVVSGDATVTASSVTDAAGQASATLAFGLTPGAVVVRASALSGSVTADFNETSTDATGLVIVSGNGQSDNPSATLAQPLVVRIIPPSGVASTGSGGKPSSLSGIVVTWTVTAGGGSVSSGTSLTDANGEASVQYTLGSQPGANTIQASAPGVTAVSFSATALPPTLTVVSGDGQARLAGTVADNPLVVKLLDGTGVPMSGQTVTWTVISGDATVTTGSVTDGTGQASATLTFGPTPGPVVVRASAVSGTATVDFNETSANASALMIVSGDGQSGEPGTALPQPLVVKLVPPAGVTSFGRSAKPQSLSGIVVTWSVLAGGGTVSSGTSLTDATGQASVQYTLGPAPGTNTIQASAPGASTTFSIITVAPPPAVLAIVSGNNQSLAPGTSSAPLVVQLKDGHGVALAGVSVQWSSSTATLSSATSVTDANGKASVTATPTTIGLATVSASTSAPAAGPVEFSLNAKLSNLPGLGPQERAIAVMLDNACPALASLNTRTAGQQDLYALCQDLGQVNPQSAIDAISELFPDFGLALADASMLAAQSQFQNLKARIAALRSGTQGKSFGGLAIYTPLGNIPVTGLIDALVGQDGNDQQAGAGFERWGWFVSGTLGRGKLEPGHTTPAYDYDINGLTAGVDYRKNDQWIFGAAVGYTNQSTDLRSRIGKLETKGWSVSGYSTFYKENSWYSDAVLTYGHNSYDTAREIHITLVTPSGTQVIDQVARSSSSGSMLEGAFTVGRDIQKGGWSIGPYGRLLYTKLDFGTINERLDLGPGVGLGVEVDARSLSSLSSQVGAKFAFAHSADWGILMPHLQVEWEHEFRDDPQSLTARFLNDPTATPILVKGSRQDSDFFRLGVGMSLVMAHGRSGFLLYERVIARDGYSQDNLALGIRVEF